MEEVVSKLSPVKAGKAAQGELYWSHAFYPVWKMPQDDKAKTEMKDVEWQKEKHSSSDIGTSLEGSSLQNSLLYKLMSRLAPEPFPWEAERRKRRLESIAWLTGERARETLEASMAPSLSRRSGILQFGITQCMDLEVDTTSGTFSKSNRDSSIAGGKPALSEVIDAMPWETATPPSAYAEVSIVYHMV